MRRICLGRLLALGLLLLGVVPLLTPAPAMAHYTEDRFSRYVYYSNNFAVRGGAVQSHQYSNFTTSTWSGGGLNPAPRDPGHIMHNGRYYKNGVYCFKTGVWQNSSRTWSLTLNVNFDVWPYCNNGSGVHVNITLDTWHWSAFGAYWYPNYGGTPGIRPITGHCHCP